MSNSLKKSAIRDVFQTASVFAGTILGAGFASGKELFTYFVQFGTVGFFGMILSGILFFIISVKVLKIAEENAVCDFKNFAVIVFGKAFGKIINFIICGFLLILFSAMISAFGELTFTIFKIKNIYGEIILSSLCFFVFMKNAEGFLKVNEVLTPIIIVGSVFLGAYFLFFYDGEIILSFEKNKNMIFSNFAVYSVIYSAYNIITAITVIIPLNKIMQKNKLAKRGVGAGAFVMTVSGICLLIPLYMNYYFVAEENLPLLVILSKNYIIKCIYVFILISAVFTTAAANGFSLLENFDNDTNNTNNRIFPKAFICVWGTVMAQIGFSNFVEKIYFSFAIVGFAEIVAIMGYRSKKRFCNSK